MRTPRGMSLIEMLTTLFITGFIGMMMCEIAVTQNYVALKTNNVSEALVNARRVAPQFSRDIRMATSITGDAQKCEIVVPVFDVNDGVTVTGTKTIQYKIILPQNSSTFQLVRNQTVVLTGIVGPIQSGQVAGQTALPLVFQYFEGSSQGLCAPGVAPIAAVGARLTCELVGITSSRSDVSAKTYAFNTDAFARGNYQ